MINNNNSSKTTNKPTKSNSNYNIMKKQFLLAFVFVLGLGVAQAQPENQKDSLDVEVEVNDAVEVSTMNLNKIIKEVIEKTAKIQKDQKMMLDRVNKQEEAGEITAEEAEDKRDNINDQAEASMDKVEGMMERWGESYGEKWEAWAEEFEGNMEANKNGGDLIPEIPIMPPLPQDGFSDIAPADSTKKKRTQKIIISEDGITIKDGEEGDRPFALEFEDNDDDDDDEDRKTDKIERTVGYSDINFGFNQILEGGQYQVIDEPAEQQFWKSTTFELGGGWKTRIGSPYSKVYLKYGGEFSWHNFRLKGNNIISKEQGTTEGASFSADSNSISKSKFEIVYFNIPVMLQLDLSKVGDVDESFTLGVGGYGGIRLTSRRRLEFNDFEGSSVESEIKNDFFSNPFRYGAMAQVGWGSFKLTAKYDLSTFFEANKDFNKDFQMASVAFGWSF